MKKAKHQNFLVAALISFFGIFATKLIGSVYIIPLTQIVGGENMKYFSLATSFLEIFLILAISGLPFACANLVTKYQDNLKEKLSNLYFTSQVLAIFFSSIVALIIIILAKELSSISLDIKNNDLITLNKANISMIIMAISIIFISLLGSLRGIFQGLKEMKIYAYSQFIEQLIKLIALLVSAFVATKIFKLDQDFNLYLSIVVIAISSIIAYLDLLIRFFIKYPIKKINLKSFKFIASELIILAFPFMLNSLLTYGLSIIDLFLYVKSLSIAGYSTQIARDASAIYNVYALKIISIPTSLSLGFSVAAISYISNDFYQKNYRGLKTHLMNSLDLLIFLSVFFLLLIASFNQEIFYFFFGEQQLSSGLSTLEFGSQFLMIIAISFLPSLIFSYLSPIMMIVNYKKMLTRTLIFIIFLKLILIIPFTYLFSYYGAYILTILLYACSTLYFFKKLSKKFKFNFRKLFYRFLVYTSMASISIIFVKVLSIFVEYPRNRVILFFYLAVVTLISLASYLLMMQKSGLLKNILKSLRN